jgi:hypothetical protein
MAFSVAMAVGSVPDSLFDENHAELQGKHGAHSTTIPESVSQRSPP